MIQLVAILSVFALGIVFALIGAIKLKLAEKLGIDDAKVGGLISTLMFTSIFMVLLIGPLVDAWGHKPFAVLGFLLAGLAIYLFSLLKSYRGAVLACILLGIGGMCVNTVGNTLMPKVLFGGQNPPAALNFGNLFFGLGAFITPFLVGLLLSRLGFSKTVTIIALITFLPIIFALATTQYPELPPAGFKLGDAVDLLGNPAVLIAALALFCYVGLEASMGGWITTYLTNVGLTPERASAGSFRILDRADGLPPGYGCIKDRHPGEWGIRHRASGLDRGGGHCGHGGHQEQCAGHCRGAGHRACFRAHFPHRGRGYFLQGGR